MTNSPICVKLKFMDVERASFDASTWKILCEIRENLDGREKLIWFHQDFRLGKKSLTDSC